MALQFPPKENPGQSENPAVTIHSEDNGITYYWDPASNSWVLVTAQSVNKDYVDGRDELRYRRDGSDFIYGNVILKRESDFAAEPVITLTTGGALILSEQNKILFYSTSDNLPSLRYGTEKNEEIVLEFDSNYLLPRKPFRYSTVTGSRVFLVENEGAATLTLFDVQLASGVSYTKTAIRIPNDKNNAFVITSNDEPEQFGGLFVRGDSSVELVSVAKKSFIIRNSETSDSKIPFKVEAFSHKIFASQEYSTALTAGGGRVTNSANGTTEYHNFDEKNLLATKQYVDAQIQTEPGFNVCAERESDAQSGGFWRQGSSLFWKM